MSKIKEASGILGLIPRESRAMVLMFTLLLGFGGFYLHKDSQGTRKEMERLAASHERISSVTCSFYTERQKLICMDSTTGKATKVKFKDAETLNFYAKPPKQRIAVPITK